MEIEYVIIYRGCDKKKADPYKIALKTKDYDVWNQNRINTIQPIPSTSAVTSTLSTAPDSYEISGVSVGPRSVIMFFNTSEAGIGEKGKVVNSTFDTVKYYDFGCLEDHTVWKGKVKSFIIMTYDRYLSIYGVRYCDTNRDCRNTEYCLCPGGQEHPSYCFKKGKRCMNKSRFWFEFPFSVVGQDKINTNCLKNQINKFGGNNLTMDVLKQYAVNCALEKKAKIEGFSYAQNDAWFATVSIILVFILILFAVKVV